MNKPNGGPAFPWLMSDAAVPPSAGMTLRDYFAAKVVAAFYSAVADKPVRADDPREVARNFAAGAYLVADAMLAERAK